MVEESVHPAYNATSGTDCVAMLHHIPEEHNHHVRVIRIQTAMLFYTIKFFFLHFAINAGIGTLLSVFTGLPACQ